MKSYKSFAVMNVWFIDEPLIGLLEIINVFEGFFVVKIVYFVCSSKFKFIGCGWGWMFGDFDLFFDFEVFFTVFDVGLFAIIFFCFFIFFFRELSYFFIFYFLFFKKFIFYFFFFNLKNQKNLFLWNFLKRVFLLLLCSCLCRFYICFQC